MALEIYKRGRYWWLRGRIKTASGEERVHESTGETDEETADRIRVKREKDAQDALLLGPKATYTFTRAVDDYLDAGKSDQYLLKLLDHFSDTRIRDITGTDVRLAAKKLYPDAAYTTWNRQVVTPMRAVLNHAADAGKCDPIKIKGFSKRDRDSRLPATPPKRAVDRSYVDAFRQHSDNSRLSTMMLLMFQTGARISDAVRLEWRDVDLKDRVATFRDMKNGEDGEGDLTVELVYELQQLLADARTDALADGRHVEEIEGDRVFGYQHRWSVYKPIKRICKEAGIPYLGTHQPGRHSFATEMLVKNRVDVATTAKKGRWKSKKILVEHYAHGDDGREVIDKVFGRKKARAKRSKAA